MKRRKSPTPAPSSLWYGGREPPSTGSATDSATGPPTSPPPRQGSCVRTGAKSSGNTSLGHYLGRAPWGQTIGWKKTKNIRENVRFDSTGKTQTVNAARPQPDKHRMHSEGRPPPFLWPGSSRPAFNKTTKHAKRKKKTKHSLER